MRKIISIETVPFRQLLLRGSPHFLGADATEGFFPDADRRGIGAVLRPGSSGVR
jgi:hypothetical protein